MHSFFRILELIAVVSVLALTGGIIMTHHSEVAADDNCITASIAQNSFELDGAQGTGNFETDLTLKNSCDSSKNITVDISGVKGKDTKDTNEIYPHLYMGSRDKGKHLEDIIDGSGTKKYTLKIKVNETFADEYSFHITVTNTDDNKVLDPIDVTLTVTKYNNVKIAQSSTDTKKDKVINRKIDDARETTFDVVVTNEGNIYRESVHLEVDYPKSNFSVTIVYPDGGDSVLIDPYFFSEFDSSKIITVKLKSLANTGGGKFDITITAVTDEVNNQGANQFKGTVTVNIIGEHVVTPQPPPNNKSIPWTIIGGILGIAIAVMGAILYVFVIKGGEEEEEGWGTAGEWDTGGFAAQGTEEFTAPVTAPPPGRAPPARRPAPAAPQAPAGPVHVKCPHCHTTLKITNPKRPLTISCPKCGTKFTIKGKAPSAPPAPTFAPPAPKKAPAPKPAAAGPVHVKCPHCHTTLKITNPKRPLTISCPKCGTKFTIKGGGAPAPPKPAPKPAAAPKPASAGALITCPKCHTKFRVKSDKRPITVACPHCHTKLTLK